MTSSPEVLCQFVSAWLSSIPPPDANNEETETNPTTALSPLPCRKGEPRSKKQRLSSPRKDDNPNASWASKPFPSPPATAIAAMDPTLQSQRQKRSRDECDDDDDDNDDDDDENGIASASASGSDENGNGNVILGLQHSKLDESTPRAERAGHAQLPTPVPIHLAQNTSIAGTPTPSISSHAPSLASRTSSPTKQMRFASLDVTGYLIKSFSTDGDTMPSSLAQVHLQLTDIQEKVAIIPNYLKDESVLLLENWRAPGIKTYTDPSWTTSSAQIGLVPLTSATASIIPQFRPKTVPSKMVDYCVHVVPTCEEKARIDQLCMSRPAASINHTDWGNLSGDPIALSIETKRDGEGLEQALSQIGTWHACQWRSLLHEKQYAPSGIEFLPALIAQGHTWYFVATTRQDSGQAWLYTKMEVGTTETLVGTYQILVALQYLKCWIEDVYWPAFRAYMLALL
ncbi:hypothetical protein CH63R_14464 [Colletotrichum higginsianum IMI 349063]|uniref:PD-(D/E)XK nuclease-like domain-containing protein n=1 Tax=Colletotrichum higginsianum (strain IMI 349063) TaxID=759273 RepID=A0A1B7XQX7_COLHI|nr:hypothetical protein CH63R_14464 [Colletotrichum higginsianum IMI 349063]OBR02163.1 hypothetical protein CH63R_14464 [Colletotrichum higginsianum IMI 349063]